MGLTPEELAKRVIEGGRLGAQQSAIIRRARRKRYLEGRMTEFERVEYEKLLEKRRKAARLGGKTRAKQVAAAKTAALKAARDEAADTAATADTVATVADPTTQGAD